MIKDVKTRWDFIGLSSEIKPSSDSAKVVNGSTFYEVDTSNIYFYYEGHWYKKIKDGKDSTVKTLTKFDYNYPIDNPICIAGWLLSPDYYTIEGENVIVSLRPDESHPLAF